ncbi:hypothetical protein [Nocardia mexicana]|uniref:Phosphatidylinositol 3-/4-kinase n=2 Tax=Nocardia mexicana TaxID=279262 RepID=A0A370GFP5_9NOCA|nr:hypothetical protein [Nocardia mexicana]RDI42491.1 phosphatidylinositol 3-/4-kinase [Nocardia mexicana]
MPADHELPVRLDSGDWLGRHRVKVDIAWLFREANERVATALDGAGHILERPYRATTTTIRRGHDQRVDVETEGTGRLNALSEGNLSRRSELTGYQPTPAELRVRNHSGGEEVHDWLPDGDDPTNQVHLIRVDENESYIYKPISGEKLGRRWGIPPVPGEAAKREVAASRLNELLGFRLVPPTSLIDGPHGPGSLQRFIPNTSDAKVVSDYPELQQHQMAVLDFILGNSDRVFTNWRTTPEGDLVAFDHELVLPESPVPLFGDLQASFSSYFLRSPGDEKVPLHEDVMQAVSSVDPNQIRLAFEDLGLSDNAIQGALDRLDFVRSEGMVPSHPFVGRLPRIRGITPVVE